MSIEKRVALKLGLADMEFSTLDEIAIAEVIVDTMIGSGMGCMIREPRPAGFLAGIKRLSPDLIAIKQRRLS